MKNDKDKDINNRYEIIRSFGEKPIKDIIKNTVVSSVSISEDN